MYVSLIVNRLKYYNQEWHKRFKEGREELRNARARARIIKRILENLIQVINTTDKLKQNVIEMVVG